MLDEPGLDTPLAYWLHLQRRLEPQPLRQLLQEARAGGVSLASLLVQRGDLPREEVERALRTLTGGDPGGWTPGGLVDDYVLTRRLGTGGMGQVFLARHRQTGAEYALKTLACLPDARERDRFEREAQAQAAAEGHPHVVRLHAYGTLHGRPYLVMDLARGGDLGQRLRGGPLAPEAAARLVADLARGLEHCHARGILHRDLKPQNVLFDEEGRPQLVDFGLAHLAGARSLTETGTLLGTPNYMAPEQALGQSEALGPATDVYGLGAVLYRCLAGRPPHGGGSLWATLEAVVQETPPPPSSLVPGVPAALDAVCARALAKQPAQRYPSAAALGEALEAALTGAAPRRRAPLGLLAVAVLLLGGVAALTIAPAPSALPAPTPSGRSPPPPRASAPAPSAPSASPVGPPEHLRPQRPSPLEALERLESRVRARQVVGEVPDELLLQAASALLSLAPLPPDRVEATPGSLWQRWEDLADRAPGPGADAVSTALLIARGQDLDQVPQARGIGHLVVLEQALADFRRLDRLTVTGANRRLGPLDQTPWWSQLDPSSPWLVQGAAWWSGAEGVRLQRAAFTRWSWFLDLWGFPQQLATYLSWLQGLRELQAGPDADRLGLLIWLLGAGSGHRRLLALAGPPRRLRLADRAPGPRGPRSGAAGALSAGPERARGQRAPRRAGLGRRWYVDRTEALGQEPVGRHGGRAGSPGPGGRPARRRAGGGPRPGRLRRARGPGRPHPHVGRGAPPGAPPPGQDRGCQGAAGAAEEER